MLTVTFIINSRFRHQNSRLFKLGF